MSNSVDQINFALLLLRVTAGVTLALHGLNKSKNLAGTGRWFASMGMKPGALHARLACFTEIGAGAAMALGLLTPFAGAGFVSIMIVAGVTAHRDAGFFVFRRPTEGWEYVMVLGVIGAAMGGLGAGQWSLDDKLDWRYADKGLWISLGLGLGGAAALLVGFWRPPAPAPKADA
jgi:putative oxidoreductase